MEGITPKWKAVQKSRDTECSTFRSCFVEGNKLCEEKDEVAMQLTLLMVKRWMSTVSSDLVDQEHLIISCYFKTKILPPNPQHLAFLQQLLKLMETMVETMLWLATLCYHFTSGMILERLPLLEASRSITLPQRMSDVRWAKMFNGADVSSWPEWIWVTRIPQ